MIIKKYNKNFNNERERETNEAAICHDSAFASQGIPHTPNF